uniref:Uncharacterized protein n=1 Tax=Proteus mirabilis TaxID=584 RepID=G8DR91_PROMI|nr:hypothetical protein [Proteus mirabilis]
MPVKHCISLGILFQKLARGFESCLITSIRRLILSRSLFLVCQNQSIHKISLIFELTIISWWNLLQRVLQPAPPQAERIRQHRRL